jgi:glutathione synthase/RimK-type ligase-like ATP-grasp enzyme
MSKHLPNTLPKIAFLYLDHVQRFFDYSNFKGWPDKIEKVVYHWGKDKERFIDAVKRKKIEVLIGNIPATAYETFREIARALPAVQFIPSLDSQFSNKSKENVTRFCKKYALPIPNTHIFYQPKKAFDFLAKAAYPLIIKKSYGPSNYGGYFVHKVDSFTQACELLQCKKYHPVYVQDFIPIAADIRVMLIGHKPVCAFWRRPPLGKWLTNTSQGGSMDYKAVPRKVLQLSVKASKAANAEFWACDIAVGKDGQYRILECATAFAAFSYIRDWIGQYLMWSLSSGQLSKPYIPLYNWEELGKINSALLRTMRHISFSRQCHQSVNDSGETFDKISADGSPLLNAEPNQYEEWPSDVWNYQDNYARYQPILDKTSAEAVQLVDAQEHHLPMLNNLGREDKQVKEQLPPLLPVRSE